MALKDFPGQVWKVIEDVATPGVNASQAGADIKPGSRGATVLGNFSTTAYGPPWTGPNGTGITAMQVNLTSGPKIYGVAVDPTVIPLGTNLLIWPNPFNYKGTFVAFDTGKAIKGNRIDFYDWRGRQTQLKWGKRNVKVAKTDKKQTSGVDTNLDFFKGGAAVQVAHSDPMSGIADALIAIAKTLLSPKGLGTLLARMYAFLFKLIWKAVWDVVLAPPWHWTQRAVDYYWSNIMSGKQGDKLYYRQAALVTISFWATAYAILWGKAEDGPGLADSARQTMLGRTVRTAQNVGASRKVISPKKVEAKTAKKPDAHPSNVEITQMRVITVTRRRPVSVKSANDQTEGTSNAPGKAHPDNSYESPEQS